MAAPKKTRANSRQEKPRLAIVYRPLAELTPYANNARTHSAEQVAQIAAGCSSPRRTNITSARGRCTFIPRTPGFARPCGAIRAGQ